MTIIKMTGDAVATVLTQIRILDLLYVFLSFVVCTPIIEILALEWRRHRLRRQLSETRGTRVITLIHRLETAALMGVPVVRYVTAPQTNEIVAALRLAPPDKPIELVVHLPAGVRLHWGEIAAAMRQRGNVTLIVPQYALSGGGELALAAKHVMLAESALVGPFAADGGQPRGPHSGQPSGPHKLVAADSGGRSAGPRELAAAGLDVNTAVPDGFNELLRLYPQPTIQRPRTLFFGALSAEPDEDTAPRQANPVARPASTVRRRADRVKRHRR